MNFQSFFAELKRRNVYKVAVAYIVAGWALSQGIAQVFPVFDIPNWIIRLIVLLIILGLPIALVLAWTFELTPQGIKRTETADAMPEIARQKKHTWIYVVAIAGLFSIGLFFLGRYSVKNATPRQIERLQFHKNRSRCCRSIISAVTPTTLTFVKACRTKSSPAWLRWPI